MKAEEDPPHLMMGRRCAAARWRQSGPEHSLILTQPPISTTYITRPLADLGMGVADSPT